MFLRLVLIFILMHDNICLAGRKNAVGILATGRKSAMGLLDDYLKQATLSKCVPRGGRGGKRKHILDMFEGEQSQLEQACQNIGNGESKEKTDYRRDFDECLWERLSVICNF
ncbi:unnamed protein product [Cylicostephanus goldi]|uniref:Uncharacterized protein n=1 Tax=Cylicostephanus goldi TaxID=71465 RepID=A0A3P6QXM9_CYLGO|nr:unnamed protein product [Cylicostephanus goldi]